MRHTVAALAGWYGFVLVLVTGHAENIFVFCITAGKHLKRTFMTGSTHFIGSVRSHENRRRHMCLMAFFTLCCDHIRAVWFVALCTERNFSVNIVTETACQAGVLALDLFQLDDLFGMTGQTLIGDIICQFNDFWGMRIVMAPQATG
jgi:hypothetical protein